jgi:nucleoside-diphosphate-sugar epimerase
MIGGHLVRRLLDEQIDVRAFVRPVSDVRALERLPVELVVGDLCSDDDAARAARGVDWVFHLAGHLVVGSAFTDERGSGDRYRRTNVDSTETLLRASAAANVARFVYTSTVSVYDLRTPSPIREDAALRPATEYGRTKLLAEGRVRAYRDELETAIVRPCIVYGEGDRHFLPAALQLARLPVLPLVDGGSRLIDLVHAADVAELMWRAAERPQAAGAVYNAASGAPVTLRRLIDELAEVFHVRPRTWSVPRRVFRRTGPLARWYVGKVSPEAESLVSKRGLELMLQDVYFDVSLAQRELAYAPRVDLRSGLASAARALEPPPT